MVRIRRLLPPLALSLGLTESVREAQFSCPNPDASGSDAEAAASCRATAAPAASSGGGDANGLSDHTGSTPPMSQFRSEKMQQFLFSDSGGVDDEATLLDLFGEAAKELLTKHIVPPTDAQCRWDWRHLRCEPHCDCALTPLYGDYSLGRACRVRYEYFEGRDTCHLPPDTPYVKVFARVANGLQTATVKTAGVARTVARRADVKRRLINLRRRACGSWEDRATAIGNEDMKRWQARICRGYDRSYDRTDEGREQHNADHLSNDDDQPRDAEADAEAADIAAKIASAKNGVSSVRDVKEAVQSRKDAMESQTEMNGDALASEDGDMPADDKHLNEPPPGEENDI